MIAFLVVAGMIAISLGAAQISRLIAQKEKKDNGQ